MQQRRQTNATGTTQAVKVACYLLLCKKQTPGMGGLLCGWQAVTAWMSGLWPPSSLTADLMMTLPISISRGRQFHIAIRSTRLYSIILISKIHTHQENNSNTLRAAV